MARRVQRAGELPVAVTRPTGRSSGRVPGNMDVVQQPGHEMEDNQSACRAGEAVSSVYGGRPAADAPQVGRKQP